MTPGESETAPEAAVAASRTAAKVLGGLAATGAAGVGYAWWEARWFTLRRVTVPTLPPGSPDLRVLHVTDLHLTPYQHRKRDWIASLASLEPDLVVDTGDNLAHPEAVEPLVESLGALLDVPGVFVLGSNDYFEPTVRNPVRYLLPDKAAVPRCPGRTWWHAWRTAAGPR
jgi:predicted MPP superfamily phosphohydrolase